MNLKKKKHFTPKKKKDSFRLFIKPGIHKRGTECGEYGERGECSLGFRGISYRIPRNVEEDSGNVQEDSGECSRRFRGMFKNIQGNVQEDSG